MRDLIREAVERYAPQPLDADPALASAAVLLLMYERQDEPYVVFQKRTEHVRDHKGQISFPGGAADPGDTSLLFTALRETREEIGVAPEDVSVFGQLDPMVTISNFRVTPYVGWLSRYPYDWHFSDEEVAYLLEVPLHHLLNPASHIPDRRTINGRTYVFPSFEWKGDLIWGATARMLSNFLDICATVPGLGGAPAPAPFEI
ncbi:MAG: CoA pyrophosphatase [Dehalococcoidia bacterium]|nr:CoA pyrophosphatase [Dehalococcoidia bacterium]